MTAAATSRTPRTPWSSGTPSRSRQKSSTTPHYPSGRTPASVGQASGPGGRLSPHPGAVGAAPRSPSPSYFGLVVEPRASSPVDSDAALYAKSNWKSASSSIGSKAATSPQPVPHEQNPDLTEFRRQSEAYAFSMENLHRFNSLSHSSPLATAPVRHEVDTHPSPPSPAKPGKLRRDEIGRTDGAADAQDDEMDLDHPPHPLTNGISAMEMDGEQLSPTSKKSPERQAGVSDTSLGRMGMTEAPLSGVDERQHRLSLPHNKVHRRSSPHKRGDSRSNSMPHQLTHDVPTLVEPDDIRGVLCSAEAGSLLLLDLRVSPQYALSHITGALNLCIPTTLLKRPSFNVQRLTDALTTPEDKERFTGWRSAQYIVFYDANSSTIRDAASSVNTLKKFTAEGWRGIACIIRGGFQAFAGQFPDLVTKADHKPGADAKGKGLSIQAGGNSVKVAGGCPMPAQKSAANPFFGNIRQNMDLIGGVGQVPVAVPEALGSRAFQNLPAWLRAAAAEEDQGKLVADKFLQIEKAEQARMQHALTADVSYDSAASASSSPPPQPAKKERPLQIAGIEKGEKNRYRDMLPYDHSRVRLQQLEPDGCDYINASHIKAQWSNRHYIATQAPVPATFEDFWRLVWEQDVRVIVMLTAEMEGGQQKCHPYWQADNHGPMKLKQLSEKRAALAPPSTLVAKIKRAATQQLLPPSPLLDAPKQAGRRRRGVTNPLGMAPPSSVHQAAAAAAAGRNTASISGPSPVPPPPPGGAGDIPHVLVRTLALSHAAQPFQPMREITQLQFSQWPDFGTVSAEHVLGLVEQCGNVARVYNQPHGVSGSSGGLGGGSHLGVGGPLGGGGGGDAAHPPVSKGERPILVHCSAGCGRTGTFCTVDSVVDMLRRQRAARERSRRRQYADQEDDGQMPVDDAEDEEDWVGGEQVDLVAKTVEDFRLQRLSMVQTLRQFVLCYEAVLEWLVRDQPDRFRRDQARRSFQG